MEGGEALRSGDDEVMSEGEKAAAVAAAADKAAEAMNTTAEVDDEEEEESEDESEILEESPCGRWQKRREEVRPVKETNLPPHSSPSTPGPLLNLSICPRSLQCPNRDTY